MNNVKQQALFSGATHTKYFLIASMVANGSLLVANISFWLIAFFVLSIIWQISIEIKLCRIPTRLLKLIVSISGLILLAISAKNLGALNAMVHLLFFSYLLKPLELNLKKDFYLLVLLGFFVIVTSLIFNQSLYFMLAISFVLILNLCVLLSFHNRLLTIKKSLKNSAVVLLKSAPLAALLFFVFPKIPPLWQMPTAKSANTGISDKVKVGDIANLALSNDLAFRVEFENFTPTQKQLYWRGIVLDKFDGIEWSSQELSRQTKLALAKRSKRLETIKQSTNLLRYRVLIEPTFQHWLFGLNQIATAESAQVDIDKTHLYTLEANKKIVASASYTVSSEYRSTISVELTNRQKRHYLTIPASNSRLIEKGKAFKQNNLKDIEIVNAVLSEFNQNDYRYTLNPPTLVNNSLDQFYFDTKSGFCEHYASSFTYLMRASGIPARVVVGYLGGEYNQQANYYAIYQRDAHAWSEVWINGVGWLRIDPTASVNPDRVERGFNQSLGDEQAGINKDLFSFVSNGFIFSSIKHYLEALDYEWTKWVVNYSSDDQKELTEKIKNFFYWSLNYLFYIVAIVTCSIACFWVYRFYIRKTRKDKMVVLYQQFINLLNKVGFTYQRQTTLNDITDFVIQHEPRLVEAIEGFCLIFNELRYGKSSTIDSTRKQKFKQLEGYLTEIKSTLKQSR